MANRYVGLALAIVLSACADDTSLSAVAVEQETWLIAVTQPWTPPNRVAVFAAPADTPQDSERIVQAEIILVYEQLQGDTRRSNLLMNHDCAQNRSQVVSVSHFADNGAPLTTPKDASPPDYVLNNPNAIGTRIGRALCADAEQWGRSIPAQLLSSNETPTEVATALFASGQTLPSALIVSDGLISSAEDALAPARNGLVACYAPILATKTCRIMERYEFADTGTATVEGVARMDFFPGLVMSVSYPIDVRGNIVCGSVREQDVAAATLRINGALPSPDSASQIRDQIVGNLRRGVAQGQQCVHMSKVREAFSAQTTIGGAHFPQMDARIVWVSPDAGFNVGR